MPNNFLGTYPFAVSSWANMHYSKPGHDSSDATTPETAKRTLKVDGATNKIVGTGIYDFLNTTITTSLYQSVHGDGKVIIRNAIFSGHSTAHRYMSNLQFEGCRFRPTVTNRASQFDNVVKIDSELSYADSSNNWYRGCLIIGAKKALQWTYSEFGYCELVNTTIVSGELNFTPNPRYTHKWAYCYFGKSVTMRMALTVSQTQRLENNCIQCPINVDGVLYECKRQKDGTLYPGADPALPDVATVAPGFYSQGNFNEDPGFMPGTYVPAMGSPLLLGASKYIGYMGPTMRVYMNQLRTNEFFWHDGNSQLNAEGHLVLKAGAAKSRWQIIKKVSDTPTRIGKIEPLWNPTFKVENLNDSSQVSEVLDIQFEGYPRLATTTAAGATADVLEVAGNTAQPGEWVMVLGEYRQVTAVNGSTINLATPLRAAVASGVSFRIGTESQIAAINHNYLGFLARVSNSDTVTITPDGAGGYILLDSEWDNDQPNPALNGYLFKQRYYEMLSFQEQGLDKPDPRGKWVHIVGELTNNYKF